jgi:hypothetical protein
VRAARAEDRSIPAPTRDSTRGSLPLKRLRKI